MGKRYVYPKISKKELEENYELVPGTKNRYVIKKVEENGE